MRGLFWVALGATAAVLLARRVRRTTDSLEPPALMASVSEAARDFASEVRAGMAEREAELRSQLGLDQVPDGPEGRGR
jgi:Family of unknown function (DUF6167)